MNGDNQHSKRHSRVLNVFLTYGIQGIFELGFGTYILFMGNMPKIIFIGMMIFNIAYLTLTTVREHILWEVCDEVLKDNERRCADYTLKALSLSLMLACIPFLFIKTKINLAASFCFVISYASFLYFVIYAIIAHRQKKQAEEYADDIPAMAEPKETAR